MRHTPTLLVWVVTAFSILAWYPLTDFDQNPIATSLIRAMATAHLCATVLVFYFRFFQPKNTAYMRLYARIYSPDGHRPAAITYQWIALQQISPAMQLAAIAGEDPLFPRHNGFDWDSIRSAAAYNRTAERKRGASGITQQLAKNLFLWSAPSLTRKLIEAYLTVLIEAFWTKRRILEMYLNVAQFGQTIFGVEAASRHYFSKPASNLDDREAALLTAILPMPSRGLSPQSPDHHVKYRQVMILRSMKTLGPDYLQLL